MPFIVIMLICAAIGVAVPRFTWALNWLVLFPIMTMAFGSIMWCATNVVTGFSLMSLNSYLGFILLVGLPMGIFVTNESMS